MIDQTQIDAKLATLNKFYFSIKEVSEICGETDTVLRYWETEFKQLNPKKVQSQRRYEKKHIAIVLTIKDLLRNHKQSIDGARKYFLTSKKKPKVMKVVPPIPISQNASQDSLKEIKNHLRQLLNFL